MRVCWAGVERGGDAIDLRDVDVEVAAVAAAVADPGDDRIACRPPGPVAERVGVVHRGMSVDVRTAVATAVRTTRVETPVDHALARAERARESVTVPSTAVAEARAAVAAATEDETALRERVARLGGRVEALREEDADAAAADAAADLEAAIAALSEVETDRVAAEQRLARRRERARHARDARDRRRRLADRVDNRRREARDWLVDHAHDRFRAAVTAVPGPDDGGAWPHGFDAPDWVAALAVHRLAAGTGPAVVGHDVGFETAAAARDVLGRPTVLVEV